MTEFRLLALPRWRSPSFLALTAGWAVISFHLIVLGSTLFFTLEKILRSFPHPAAAIYFALYIWFGAPVLVGWTALLFLKSVLLGDRGAARLGFFGSLGVLGLWTVLLAVQF